MIKKSDALREYRNKLALVLGSEFKIITPSDYKVVYFKEKDEYTLTRGYYDVCTVRDLHVEIHSGAFLFTNYYHDYVSEKTFKKRDYKQKFFLRNPITIGADENWWNEHNKDDYNFPSLLGKRVASDFVILEISDRLYNKYKHICEIGFVEKTYEDEAPEGALSDFQKIMGVL